MPSWRASTGGGALHCAIGEAAEQIADHPALRIPHSQGTQPGVEEADAAGEIGQIVPAQQGLLPQKAVSSSWSSRRQRQIPWAVRVVA